MAGTKRGFGREQNTGMKAVITVMALVAFVAGWVGFADGNGNASKAAVSSRSVSGAAAVPGEAATGNVPLTGPRLSRGS
jgi:hypothetical protein